jgi:tRNA(Ile)-lysidine synthase
MLPAIRQVLACWLNAEDDAPVAVALSGGGDSLALLHAAKAWADGAGRRLIALTVDHGLQNESAAWSRFAAERAARLGIAHRTLVWAGEKPRSGVPAKARWSRHALLAEAARRAGARVVLMGHTADDVAEAEVMRAAGVRVSSPNLWAPSPVWPEGRGVFLLRPLLGLRREDLRSWLRSCGETWIEDPANDDVRYARAAARRRIAEDRGARFGFETPTPSSARVPEWVAAGAGGEFVVRRRGLCALEESRARRVIGALALCASGGARPPAGRGLTALIERLNAPAAFATTLAGARVEADEDKVIFCREVGERRRRGLGPSPAPPGESVFDGRFLIQVEMNSHRLSHLAGLSRRLPPGEQARLRQVSAPARPALPVLIEPGGTTSCPALSDEGTARASALTFGRFAGAIGAIGDERALAFAQRAPSRPVSRGLTHSAAALANMRSEINVGRLN